MCVTPAPIVTFVNPEVPKAPLPKFVTASGITKSWFQSLQVEKANCCIDVIAP